MSGNSTQQQAATTHRGRPVVDTLGRRDWHCRCWEDCWRPLSWWSLGRVRHSDCWNQVHLLHNVAGWTYSTKTGRTSNTSAVTNRGGADSAGRGAPIPITSTTPLECPNSQEFAFSTICTCGISSVDHWNLPLPHDRDVDNHAEPQRFPALSVPDICRCTTTGTSITLSKNWNCTCGICTISEKFAPWAPVSDAQLVCPPLCRWTEADAPEPFSAWLWPLELVAAHRAQYLYTAPGRQRLPHAWRVVAPVSFRGLTAGTCTGNHSFLPPPPFCEATKGAQKLAAPEKNRSPLGQNGNATCMCGVCHMRATVVRACTCVVTLFTPRYVRCQNKWKLNISWAS